MCIRSFDSIIVPQQAFYVVPLLSDSRTVAVEQDQHLEALGNVINRTKHMAVDIGNEIDEQTRLIGGTSCVYRGLRIACVVSSFALCRLRCHMR